MQPIKSSPATYLGIKWFSEQRLPEPFREITQQEHDWLLLRESAICGTFYEQCFLDWGHGPLMKNPVVSWWPAKLSYYDLVGHECQIINHGEKHFGIVKQADGDTIHVETDLMHFIGSKEDVMMKCVFTGSGGWRGNQWATRMNWYTRYGLAVANIYCDHKQYLTNVECYEEQDYDHPSFITGMGTYLHEFRESMNGYGFALRFFKIGCEHPNMQQSNPRMFEHSYDCPDCGWSEVTDSSG